MPVREKVGFLVYRGQVSPGSRILPTGSLFSRRRPAVGAFAPMKRIAEITRKCRREGVRCRPLPGTLTEVGLRKSHQRSRRPVYYHQHARKYHASFMWRHDHAKLLSNILLRCLTPSVVSHCSARYVLQLRRTHATTRKEIDDHFINPPKTIDLESLPEGAGAGRLVAHCGGRHPLQPAGSNDL